MPALELLSGGVTAPSTTNTALTMASGDSLAIRNAASDSKILLLSAWGTNQTAGHTRIRSPQLHDNVRGIQIFNTVDNNDPAYPSLFGQKLKAQDTLIVEQTGSATGGDIEMSSLLVYYDDLPGIAANLISIEDLLSRGINIMSVENTITLATGPNYTGSEAITVDSDLLKANTNYALIGYNLDVQCGAVRWSGVDTGNLGVGGPGRAVQPLLTASWFADLSQKYNLPLIPVFNSANKGAIMVSGQQDEDAGNIILQSIFVELSS